MKKDEKLICSHKLIECANLGCGKYDDTLLGNCSDDVTECADFFEMARTLPHADRCAMNVMGLDLSLTGTGLVVLNNAGATIHSTTISSKYRGMERLDYVRGVIRNAVATHKPELIAIEGYNRGAKNGREEAGELSGIIRLMLYRNNFKYILASPGQVKKFATGKGVAEKSLMMMKVFKKWGFEAKTDDEADAYCLSRIAQAHHFGNSDLTSYQAEVIEMIRNPPQKVSKKK